MGERTDEIGQTNIQQVDFERIATVVSAQFQVEESLIEHSSPTFYITQGQETKQPFLRLLRSLEPLNLTAILRRIDERIVLRIIPKQPVKPSNILVNWILFFATIATTFVTGYLLSAGLVEIGAMPSPFIGAVTFMIAIMTVLGLHEIGHKLTADKRGIDATSPYFIPGPPPILGGFGTFGAVIVQKSLPPNKDALFDVGSSGPIWGFVLASVVSIVGLMASPVLPIEGSEVQGLPIPLIFQIFLIFVIRLPPNHYVLPHPVAFAGWIGMIITMLNLLPAAMLDGGHISRSLFGERARSVLTALSILFLIVSGEGIFWAMAILVLFMSTYKHPGPLDDVSSLSTGRKIQAVILVVIFLLCSFIQYLIFDLMRLLIG
jgi:membrane-associated protease RseP (regulator of RpoE activity)